MLARVRLLKRFAVTIVGVALLALGVVMMVLPGPGILGLVAGLAVLATEYAWARRLLTRAKKGAVKAQEAAVASPLRTAGSVVVGLGMVAVGVLMLVVDDVAWPVWDRQLDAVWAPFTGGVIAVMGCVVVTTTVVTLRTAHGEPTTHVPDPQTRPTERPAVHGSHTARG